MNNTRTRLITNTSGDDLVITFPTDDITVVDGLQVYVVSGTVEFKGIGKLLGENSDYIPIPEGSSMNFANVGNNNPNGQKTIKLADAAVVAFIAYD